MKKLLTLLSLTLSMTAFAAPQGNVASNDSMKVTARVIAPLTVVAQQMEFGDIIQGSTAEAESIFTIKGEPQQKIDFTITGIDKLVGENGAILPIVLEGINNLPTSINESGTIVQNIKGIVNPTKETTTGDYVGYITARVQYQ